MNKQKGFTIIELIVVIAIIAVLAGIVLVNVTGYINKGKDAAAESNLETMMTDAAVFFDSTTGGNGTYSGLQGASSGFPTIVTALSNAGYTAVVTCDVASCGLASSKWCASVPLKADTTKGFCVDSSGAKKMGAVGNVCAAGVCP